MQDNFVSGAPINYLIEGLNSHRQFTDMNNINRFPRISYWDAANAGCNEVTRDAFDKVAQHPGLAGYTDIHEHYEK
jgi:hypothetical protein